VDDIEKEARYRLIDAARTDALFLAERQTGLGEALDRLNRQAYGDPDRLRGAAEQLRRRFSGAEAISLLEAAAHHAQDSTEADPAVLSERPDRADTGTATPAASVDTSQVDPRR
jgi:hypothetical protein